MEVMFAEMEQHGLAAPLRIDWNGRVASEFFDPMVDDFLASLFTDEVNDVSIGNLTGFVVGGMSGGEDPTETWSLWNNVIYDSDPDWGNPYADECYTAFGFLDSAETTPQAGWVRPEFTLRELGQMAEQDKAEEVGA